MVGQRRARIHSALIDVDSGAGGGDRRVHGFTGSQVRGFTVPVTALNGKQYVAVFSGEGQVTGGPITQMQIKPVRNYNALYVFAVP
jgi:hypothetical protein